MASEQARGTAQVDAAQAEQLHSYAHDLKNRLAGLLEVLRQLREPSATEEQGQLFDFGERQIFAVLRRTDAMLDDIGVPRAMPTPHTEPVDLLRALDAAVENQRYRFDRKQQSISISDSGALTVAADPRQLATMLEALLSNASKFSAPGSVINVRPGAAEGQVSVAVQDNGVGLSAEDLKDVFVRYAWLASTSTAGETQGRSTLALCRRIAEAHRGSLTAQSDGKGKGALFTLRLPTA